MEWGSFTWGLISGVLLLLVLIALGAYYLAPLLAPVLVPILKAAGINKLLGR